MKIWNPERYHDRFQTRDKKKQPLGNTKTELEFQTLEDKTNTPTILPYKTLPQVDRSRVKYMSNRSYNADFLYWYQEFLCPVEPLYFSDEKSITVEK